MDKRSYAVVTSPGKPGDNESAKRIKIVLTPEKKTKENNKNATNSQAEIDAELEGLNFDDDDDIFNQVRLPFSIEPYFCDCHSLNSIIFRPLLKKRHRSST